MANIAIMGFGTVGGGVAEVLRRNSAALTARLGEPLRLQYILDVRDLSATPYASLAVKDIAVLENDDTLDVAVECIGGTGAALEFTRRLLSRGKHVVTSNKELVATHGRALLELAQAHGARYLFEASVGGGIPVLGPLTGSLGGNQIEEIVGILNGTTNYILTRMERGGLDFAAALREAQEKGYAEHNPAADVDGLDAGRKICILSDLAWGQEVAPGKICIQGIGGVDTKDAAIARAAGYRLKLLGRALHRPDGRTAVYVAPHLVPESSPLAEVEDVFNGILIRGNAVGEVLFCGPGAGDLPTASAVVGDVLEILEGRARALRWSGEASLVDVETDLPLFWYFRGMPAPMGAEVLAEDAAIAGPFTASKAKRMATEVGAATLLPVLR